MKLLVKVLKQAVFFDAANVYHTFRERLKNKWLTTG